MSHFNSVGRQRSSVASDGRGFAPETLLTMYLPASRNPANSLLQRYARGMSVQILSAILT